MRKDWKYILYVAIVIGVYVVVRLSGTKQNDWNVTLAHEDKEPYGTYAFNQLLPSYFADKKIRNSYKTFYELKDSLKPEGSLIILATSFSTGKADTEALFKYVEQGGTAFISANYFNDYFADTLGLRTRDYFFKDNNPFNKQDTSWLNLTNLRFDSTDHYLYKRSDIHNYFSRLDSSQATVISKNDQHQPVTVRIEKGKGQLILNCTPMAFTNIYLLAHTNNKFIANTLSYLPQEEVYRTEFYHLGRMEANTPLRFVLTNEPLKWAYYITLLSILFFMIFEAKRKQRIIPVISPLTNTTLEFISTIGSLYFQRGDHKNIAEKKIQFFFEQIRTNYYMTPHHRDEVFITNLAKKSGNTEPVTRDLIKLIDHILLSAQISKEALIDLNDKLEKFNAKMSK